MTYDLNWCEKCKKSPCFCEVLSEAVFIESSAPTVVCLCGSTRFVDAFREANRIETMAGKVVLAPGVFAHAGDPLTDDDKARLDALHFCKINMSDEVLILNVDGYIGSSTKNELDYANARGKPVRFLEG